jgi:ornithine carbamoyltransferase
MANSIIAGGLKCGMDVSVACPDTYRPHKLILDFAAQQTSAKFELTNVPAEAAQGATSPSPTSGVDGMEKEAERAMAAFRGIR